MITIKDVANKTRVSVATVSRVLNDSPKVSPSTAEKVQKVIEELDYSPDLLAKGLKTQKTHTFGLIISDISNPFFSSLARGVEDVALENDHNLVVCNTDKSVRKEELYIKVLLRKNVDGFLIAPADTEKSHRNIELLLENKSDFVFVDRKVNGIASDAVLSENEDGAYRATRYLIKKGHDRVGIVSGGYEVTSFKERLRGYKKALEESEITFEEDLVVEADTRVEKGRKATKKLLTADKKPTGIFTINRMLTVGALQAIDDIGISRPKDVELVGFDDFELASVIQPGISTVDHNPYKIGSLAAEKLIEGNESRNKTKTETIRVPTHLLVRNSRT